MIPRNLIATDLLAALAENDIEAKPGYFGGSTYCVGVVVFDFAEAFALGAKLGTRFGKIAYDRHHKQAGGVVVFRDALVTA